jgi:hypothetical protein
MELKDWLNSIYFSKKNLLEEVDNPNQYPAFIVNRMLSGNIDTALFASELNERFTMDKEMQYKFLLYAVPKRKRFSNYLKKNSLEDLELVKSYYGYNNEKAIEALKLLSKEQIDYIKEKLNVGGI